MITPAGSFIDNPSSSGGASGVSSLNSETGAVVIVAGSGITVTPAGQNITIAAVGGGGTSFGRNVISSTTYTTIASDVGKVLDVQTSAATTITLLVSTPFSGFIQNNGTSIVTITPTSGLIQGKASIVLEPGQGCAIGTDGTNFTAVATAYLGADEIPYTAGSLDDEFLGTSLDLARWTWDNQASEVATVARSRVAFTGAGAAQTQVIYQTAPATPWEVTAGPFVIAAGNISESFGLLLRDGTGKIMQYLQYSPGITTENILFQRLNSSTSFNANINGSPAAWPFSRLRYLRIKDDGVNLTYSASTDGIGFYQTFQEGRTAWFGSGPTQVGIGIGTSTGGIVTLDWFRRTL